MKRWSRWTTLAPARSCSSTCRCRAVPGFDLLAQLERLPRVIFTTAYDHYAVKAFEVSAVDYLLKPIEPERLAAALSKVQAAALAAMSSTLPANEPASKQEGRSNRSSCAMACAAGSCRCGK